MDPGELQMVREVVRPKTPRGDGNWIALTGLALILVVVRPKTPRGDGNSTSISLTSPGEKITSSDPKPRERTETRRRSRRCRCPNRRVVRPKTPRGDGNLERVTADGTIETSRQTQNPERGRKPAKYRLHDTTTTRRQTQNPERGRKLLTMRLPRALFQPSSDPKPREGTETGSRQTGSRRSSPVVRPKTPRGDGNFITPDQIGIGVFKSSDPKPREGTETF